MKRIMLLVQFLAFTLIVNAQENRTYQLNDRTIEFTVSQEEIYVEFESSKKASVQKQANERYKEINNNSAILKVTDLSNSYLDIKRGIQSVFKTNFNRIEPVLIYKDGTKQIAKGELNIKLKAHYSIADVLKGHQYECQSNEFESDMYLVKFNLETSDLFNLVNQLQIDDRVVFAEPNFIRRIKPNTLDQFFPLQWSINNQIYYGSTDADMNVEEAWAYATGSSIKVAIIDEGVDLEHEDLEPNMLPGYDATNINLHGAPNEARNDAHGTACAGIVAAVANNQFGIAGVAYNAKIIPVRVGYSESPTSRYWESEDIWVANGINWAWQNGADVLSNSYGGGSFSFAIVYAINNAVNLGRNGKGSIVLFSSGNDERGDGEDVSFPAYINNVIAVGASTMCNERKTTSSCDGENDWASNYGNALDVVAPGVEIITTDITGDKGYDESNYDTKFRGTSAACPNAAGVAALVLSVNPNFTQAQVREILETTTDKVGSTPYNVAFQNYGGTQTWNNEMGYGRLNAESAVQKALIYDNYTTHYITGPTQITPGTGGFYKISNPYTYATNYVWTIPSGCYSGYCWEIVQGQGTYKPIIHGGTLGVQQISCKIYNGSTVIGQQYFTVNVQNPYNGGGGSGDPCGGLQTGPTKIYPPIPCDDNGPNSVNQSNNFKTVYIYSISGQVVLQLDNVESVDISHLSSGLYFVKAQLNNNTILTKKIVKK